MAIAFLYLPLTENKFSLKGKFLRGVLDNGKWPAKA